MEVTTLFIVGIPTIGFIFYALLETGKITDMSSIPILGNMFPKTKSNVYHSVEKGARMKTPDGEYRISKVEQSEFYPDYYQISAVNNQGEKHIFNVYTSNLFPIIPDKNYALSMTNPSEAVVWCCNINRNGMETKDFEGVDWNLFEELVKENLLTSQSKDTIFEIAQNIVSEKKLERKEIEKGEDVGKIKELVFGKREKELTVIDKERKIKEEEKSEEERE